jgi:hypothetical protein
MYSGKLLKVEKKFLPKSGGKSYKRKKPKCVKSALRYLLAQTIIL